MLVFNAKINKDSQYSNMYIVDFQIIEQH